MDPTDHPPLLPDPAAVEFDDGFEDDDYVPVVAHKRDRLLGTSSYFLLAALLVVGGFVGGAKWKSGHPTSTATAAGNANAAAAFAGRGANGGGAFANGGAAATGGAATTGGAAATGGAGGATVGQIKLVDGTNVYVQDAQGNVVKVTTGADTTVQVSKTGTVADLKAGDTVIVQGAKGADGTIAATTIGSGTGTGGGFGRRQGTPTTTTTG
ncbi:MAG: hypothetical protein QOD72_1348 [Acidimicrobiaceae bacterium]|jgi:hypothetical protein|nr:hypothetical protein [Acidimicrobiaceae bacterium]